MGMRGSYHKERVAELVENFKKWRSQRSPGTRAFQSTYDRCDLSNPSMPPNLYWKWLLELGLPFASGFISHYMICTLFQHSTTFYLSWCVLVNFRTRTFVYYLASPKYFALLNVSIIVDTQPYTNLSCSQGQWWPCSSRQFCLGSDVRGGSPSPTREPNLGCYIRRNPNLACMKLSIVLLLCLWPS